MVKTYSVAECKKIGHKFLWFLTAPPLHCNSCSSCKPVASFPLPFQSGLDYVSRLWSMGLEQTWHRRSLKCTCALWLILSCCLETWGRWRIRASLLSARGVYPISPIAPGNHKSALQNPDNTIKANVGIKDKPLVWLLAMGVW